MPEIFFTRNKIKLKYLLIKYILKIYISAMKAIATHVSVKSSSASKEDPEWYCECLHVRLTLLCYSEHRTQLEDADLLVVLHGAGSSCFLLDVYTFLSGSSI